MLTRPNPWWNPMNSGVRVSPGAVESELARSRIEGGVFNPITLARTVTPRVTQQELHSLSRPGFRHNSNAESFYRYRLVYGRREPVGRVLLHPLRCRAVCAHARATVAGSAGLFGRGDRKKKLLYAENMLIRSCSCVIVSVITKRSGFINSGRWSRRLIST